MQNERTVKKSLTNILRNNMDKLNKVATALMEKEVISAEEFQELIK